MLDLLATNTCGRRQFFYESTGISLKKNLAFSRQFLFFWLCQPADNFKFLDVPPFVIFYLKGGLVPSAMLIERNAKLPMGFNILLLIFVMVTDDLKYASKILDETTNVYQAVFSKYVKSEFAHFHQVTTENPKCK